ncbi:MAG: PEP-CTERM sorting domain-containing protein [Burkholderiales bacterium]|jgi:hypothetical protein|nr:PEP-CTERM sorting domain-containing protein [Burkholderiales bacterium]
MRRTLLSSMLLSSALGLVASVAHAGPFAPAAGQPGSTAVPKDSPSIVGWASGFLDYVPGPNVDAGFRTPAKALGPAVGDSFDIVSLGDAGRITLTFDRPITNGAGFDFAIFENSFSDGFLELAFVEVSSNGIDFARFAGISLTAAPVSGFGVVDPTNVSGLAGKYRQGFGTPFDLSDLLPAANVDVTKITHVRLVDITGDGSQRDNWPVALGGPNRIYDPFPSVGSGGFDLDAVGVMHFVATTTPVVPEPSTFAVALAGLGLLGASAARRRARNRRA